MDTREGGARYESQDVENCGSQDRRQLLKRTRSLAVISEDSSRKDRESRHFCIDAPEFEIPRRPQLIPRAKLINRNSLKDRLSKSQQHLSESYDKFNESRSYHSHSTCELYSVPPALSSLPNPPLYGRTSRADPDRLNILDWPRTPRRYRSYQDLDTVSGLVDIVEDNLPIDNNHEDRSTDCIYTQVKRKRKEHRSLDSILLEDDDELEYFDVLNLLPLSKVRLEFDESDESCGNINFCNKNTNQRAAGRRSREFTIVAKNGVVFPSERDDEDVPEDSSIEHSELNKYRASNDVEITEICSEKTFDFGNNFTDEEKSKSQPTKEYPKIVEFHERCDSQRSWGSLTPFLVRKTIEHDESAEAIESSAYTSEFADNETKKVKIIIESSSNSETESASASGTYYREEHNGETDESALVTTLKEIDKRNEVEETEDYKSIWISDTEEPDDMSRRPQVLTVVDNEVTRKRGSRASNVVDIDIVAGERIMSKDRHIPQTEINSQSKFGQNNSSDVKQNVRVKENVEMERSNENKSDVETARDFFEKKSSGKDTTRNRRNEGTFERIVKETSNILGKACNAFRGSLGFEAGSESSDLGLGSDCGSDTRRRSIDDGVDVVDDALSPLENSIKPCKDQVNHSDDEIANTGRKSRTNLMRSRSCVDSIECQENGSEFDHVRYKIVKSRLFRKNIFGNTVNKQDVTYDGLMEYLREYSFQELLLDNNVVIIEPVRAETTERKPLSIGEKNQSIGACKVSELGIKKAIDNDNNDRNYDKENEGANSPKGPKQSSLRKHFFYHPIRVNKELIDEELPDPDTVRNVRRMFENTMRSRSASKVASGADCKSMKSVSMKDLRRIEERGLDNVNERSFGASNRSRCSSRAKNLTRLFESLDKTAPNQTNQSGKGDPENPRSATKTRMLAQSFEAHSGNTSPSDAGSTRNKVSRCRHQNHHHRRQRQNNWDAGSVSSGVSSDYPDTDQGSGVHCTSSEDEEIDLRDEYESRESERVSGPFVSQDVLKKIRECGTSVTYYGGKVVNTCNGPLISPMSCKLTKRSERAFLGNKDYVKFRLVKSNSCDSRLELTGRVIERRSRLEARESASRTAHEKTMDLRESTIAETPSIEITAIESSRIVLEENEKVAVCKNGTTKREPPIVVGLEPKKEENREATGFKADFKLGKIEDARLPNVNRFGSALTRWQINETNCKKTNADFGKMEFEEFEVLEDSLNGNEN